MGSWLSRARYTQKSLGSSIGRNVILCGGRCNSIRTWWGNTTPLHWTHRRHNDVSSVVYALIFINRLKRKHRKFATHLLKLSACIKHIQNGRSSITRISCIRSTSRSRSKVTSARSHLEYGFIANTLRIWNGWTNWWRDFSCILTTGKRLTSSIKWAHFLCKMFENFKFSFYFLFFFTEWR